MVQEIKIKRNTRRYNFYFGCGPTSNVQIDNEVPKRSKEIRNPIRSDLKIKFDFDFELNVLLIRLKG